MARRANTTRMAPEVSSREQRIGALVAMGFGNLSIWAALEYEFPSIIPDDDDRRNPQSNKFIADLPPYDAEEHQRIMWAVNSTRGLAIKEDQMFKDAIDVSGGNAANIKSVEELQNRNRHRTPFREAALNFVYGETKFVHETDASNSVYKTVERTIKERDTKGQTKSVTKKVKLWVKGDWRANDPLIPLAKGNGYEITRNKDGTLRTDLDLTRQITQVGSPESFISLWAGEPGIGKSRTAIAISKGLNFTTNEATLYMNGEETEESFRQLAGHDVDPLLFKVVTATLFPIQKVIDFAYELRPRAIVIDSIQMIAEFSKGERGLKTALMALQMLKADPKAGKPHIILISQLNKQGKVKGSNLMPHLVDAVVSIRKLQGRQGHFVFEIPSKNRAGATPRGAVFKHHNGTVVGVSTNLTDAPIYKLVQPTNGVVDKQEVPQPRRRAEVNEIETEEQENAYA